MPTPRLKREKFGAPGVIGGTMLAGAGMGFLQSITTTTAASTLFTLSATLFLAVGFAGFLLRKLQRRAAVATMATAAVGIGVMMEEGPGGGIEILSVCPRALAEYGANRGRCDGGIRRWPR